jgi:aryl-alcohol dehydrogenase-like predicted oxidoreductase
MRYKLFGKHTGLRVSELVLGAGTFGTRWSHGAEPDEAGRIFNAYAEAGENFIDTARLFTSDHLGWGRGTIRPLASRAWPDRSGGT